MAVMQSNLPYETNALEPHISSETLFYHYEKHHRGYVDRLNALIEDTPYDGLALEQIIARARETVPVDMLDNALQAWNHGFLWESMSPNGGAKPEGRIKEAIERDFGDVERFKKDFRSAALGVFGSGWVWLVDDRGNLRIVTTGNADSPVGTRLTPLLTLDVWEHAYYLDYKSSRGEYVDAFLTNLINWDFAAANLDAAKARQAA
jgi:superoxide dismutase, Fe-Mn family